MPREQFDNLASRDLIARAVSVLRTGATRAAAARAVAADFPDRTNAEISYAVRTGRAYVEAAERARTTYERDPSAAYARWLLSDRTGPEPPMPRAGGKNPRGDTLANIGGPEFAHADTIGVTIFVLATLENGRNVQASIVLNVPADTPIYTLYSRANAALCLGYIRIGRRQGYRVASCQISLQTMTPYARGTGIELDVAPINRQHPNPYPPREVGR